MKTGFAVLGAMVGVLALTACQQTDSPASATTPAAPGAETPSAENLPTLTLPEGRAATAEEVARLEKMRKAPLPEMETAPGPLAKAAGLITCNIDFNSAYSLDLLPDNGWKTYATSPNNYKHLCHGIFYHVNPINSSTVFLSPEATNMCFGPSPYWGVNSAGGCVNQSDAKNWPRFSGNIGGNTGVQFYLMGSNGQRRKFNLGAVTVRQGTMDIWVYRNNIQGWWHWWGLTPGRWTFPAANASDLNEIQIFEDGYNGYISFDNIETTYPF